MEVTIADLALDLIEKICLVILFAYVVTRTKYSTQVSDRQFDARNRVFLILVFGVLRTSLVPLYTATDEQDAITPVRTKHEEGAAFMADGYAGVSGKI